MRSGSSPILKNGAPAAETTRIAALVIPPALSARIVDMLPAEFAPSLFACSAGAPLAHAYRRASLALVGDPAAMPAAVAVQRYSRIPWVAVVEDDDLRELARRPASLSARALRQASGALVDAALADEVRRLAPAARLVTADDPTAARRLLRDIALAADARQESARRLTASVLDLWSFLDARAARLSMRLLAWTSRVDRPIHPKHLVSAPWHLWYRDALRAGDRVLDLGCANGAHTLVAGRVAARAVGVDLNASELDHARRRAAREGIANVEFRTADLADPNAIEALGIRRYDVAMVLDVLEHIAERRQFLASVRRLLVPGGRLVLAVPRRDTPYKRLRRRVGAFAYADPDHKVEYDEMSLRSELSASGFEVVRLECGGYDTPFSGMSTLAAPLSLRAYARIARRRARLAELHPERTSAYRVVAEATSGPLGRTEPLPCTTASAEIRQESST